MILFAYIYIQSKDFGLNFKKIYLNKISLINLRVTF